MTEKNFNKDLVALLQAVTNPTKTKDGYDGRYRFTPYDEMLKEYKVVLKKHNFAVSQKIYTVDGVDGVETQLIHTSGEIHTSGWSKLCYSGNDSQKEGSATSYKKRYQFCALLGMQPSDEDDDGQAVVDEIKKDEDINALKEVIASKAKKKGYELPLFITYLQGKNYKINTVKQLETIIEKWAYLTEIYDRMLKDEEKENE